METPVIPKARRRASRGGLSVSQRVALALFGRAYIGDITRPGWRGSLPFYAFRCPAHGLVTNYTQGYEKRLDCPFCSEEEKTR